MAAYLSLYALRFHVLFRKAARIGLDVIKQRKEHHKQYEIHLLPQDPFQTALDVAGHESSGDPCGNSCVGSTGETFRERNG